MAFIASGDEWSARALDSALTPAGYRVQRFFTGAAVLEQTRNARPDVLLIAAPIPDIDGIELCRTLRGDPQIPSGFPVVAITGHGASREERLTWLRAGAWECFGFPLDREELLLKLDAYASARQEADRAREAALVDRSTGLYTGPGLQRRARELVAEALRFHDALACAVFGPEVEPALSRGKPLVLATRAMRARVGPVLRAHGRLSDTIGWWDGAEFAILAPATDAEGAMKLARRLARAVETTPPEPGTPDATLAVRVGFEAIPDVHATPVEADILLAHAHAALRSARSAGGKAKIRRFEAEA